MTEEIIIKDLIGNEKKIRIEIKNIDKEPPTLQQKKELSANRKNCIVKITANEQIQELTGWTLLEDKKSLTKVYEENEEEVVTVKDIVGNESKITVKVTEIETVIEINNHTIENNTIRNIQPNTDYLEFVKNITSNRIITIKEGDKEVTGTEKIKQDKY